MRNKVAIYHETLGSAVSEAERVAADNGATFAEADWKSRFEVGYYVAQGHGRREAFELATYKGKPTKRFLQVAIYRLDSGRYELTVYVS